MAKKYRPNGEISPNPVTLKLTFRLSARKKLCCTSSFAVSTWYTFFSPV
jgi:hypothetical protein